MVLNLLFGCVFVVNFVDIYSDNRGGCYITDISDEEWKTGKRYEPRLQSDFIYYNYNYKKPLGILETCHGFLNITVSEDQLIVAGDPSISEIDNIISPTSYYETACKVTFLCKFGESSLVFIQPIVDTNTYPPSFHNSSYEILIPQVIPSGTNIVDYLQNPIQVEDGDFSNYNITFEILPNDFKIETKRIEFYYKTVYIPMIMTKEIMTITDKTYRLIATDVGNIPHTLSTAITIRVRQKGPQDLSDVLYFSQPQYLLDCRCNTEMEALFSGDRIILVSGEDDVEVYLTAGDYVSYFSTFYNKTTEVVSIILSKNLPEEIFKKHHPLYFIICARYTYSSAETCSDLEINLQ